MRAVYAISMSERRSAHAGRGSQELKSRGYLHYIRTMLFWGGTQPGVEGADGLLVRKEVCRESREIVRSRVCVALASRSVELEDDDRTAPRF